MPIDNFGKSVLSKLGWIDGKPLGKYDHNNGIVKPIEFIPRVRGLGLGAKPSLKSGKEERVFGGDQTGNGGINYKSLDDKGELKEKMKIGSKVFIISGPHKNLEGKIVGISDSKQNMINQ